MVAATLGEQQRLQAGPGDGVRITEDHGVDAGTNSRRGHPVHRLGGYAEHEASRVRAIFGVEQSVRPPGDRNTTGHVVAAAADRDAVRLALTPVQQRPQQRIGRAVQVGFRQAGLDQRGGPHGQVRAGSGVRDEVSVRAVDAHVRAEDLEHTGIH